IFTEVAADPRAQLSERTTHLLYDSSFQEMVADASVKRWSRLDDLTKTLVATTASSSAVSGWALWGSSGGRSIWVLVSGIAAILSVVHTSLGVSHRINGHTDDKRRFSKLRTDVELFLFRLQQPRTFDPEGSTREYESFKEAYNDDVQL